MIAAEILDALVAAGATSEMIVAAIRADQAIEDRFVAERRQKATERKQRSRLSHENSVTSCDGAGHAVTSRDPPLSPVPLLLSPTPPSNNPLTPKPHHSDADASDAEPASRDIRADLFGPGLKSLAAITGKTPDSCRSLVGRWLKSVNDEAIHVLAAIEDAARNRVADPVAWIAKTLQSHTKINGHSQKRTVQDAANDLLAKLQSLNEPAPICDGASQAVVRRISADR